MTNIAPQSRLANPLFFAWRLFVIALTLAVLLSMGGTDWTGAYIFCGNMLLGQIGTNAVLAAYRPTLFAQRARVPNHLLTLVLTLGWTSIAAFGRYDWPVAVIGGPIMVAAYLLAGWALLSNPFAIEETKLQEGQYVVDTGPYAFMAHPIYASNCLLAIGAGLLLGPGACLIAIPVLVASIGRAKQEDDMLIFGLPGYRRYARRVKGMMI